jgi:hypothetical protein
MRYSRGAADSGSWVLADSLRQFVTPQRIGDVVAKTLACAITLYAPPMLGAWLVNAAMIAAFALTTYPAPAAAQTTAAAQNAGRNPLYPFTPDELWSRLLKVISLPDGGITPETVGAAMNVKLHLQSKTDTTPGAIYGANAFEDSYFNVIVQRQNSSRYSFLFGWGDGPKLSVSPVTFVPPGMCISLIGKDAEIRASGWVNSPLPFGNAAEYTRGLRSRLIIAVKRTGCVNVVIIRDDNH